MGRCAGYVKILAGLSCAACQNLSAESDVPAVLVDPTSAGRAELEAALHDALGERAIMLAEDVLTTSSVVTLEPSARGGPGEPPPLGRNLDRPETFQLVVNDGRCYLTRPGTDERWLLRESRCEPQERQP